MGHMGAIGMAEEAGVNETTITWHLLNNHFPPHDVALVPVALAAIEALNEGESARVIKLPEIVTYRGQTEVAAWQIVDGLHLDAFLANEGEEL